MVYAILAAMEVLQFSRLSTLSRIDAAASVIYGVSVMTIGDAKGHNMLIDETTLKQALSVAQEHKDGIKVKFGGDHKAGVSDVNGTLKAFRIEGDQLKADLHLLKSDVRNAKVIEMAQTMPDEFGLSMVFSGDHVYSKDGKAISKVNEEEAELRKLETKISRCHEIYSVDLVSDPAANPNGLFNKQNQTMKSIALAFGLPETATEAEITAKAAELLAFASKKKMEDDEEKKKLEEAEAKKKLDEKGDKDDGEKKEYDELKKNVIALSTKLEAIESADKAKLAKAHEAAVDALLADASREGKVAPAAATLYKLSVDEVKTLLSSLPKGQVNLGDKTDHKAPEFKTEGDKVKFCREQREKGRIELNAALAHLAK